MKARPPLNKIIIKQDEAENKIGNFSISETSKEKPRQGTVIKVGPGEIHPVTGRTIPMMTQEGDKVIYSEFSGQAVYIDGEEYIVVKEEDLIVVL